MVLFPSVVRRAIGLWAFVLSVSFSLSQAQSLPGSVLVFNLQDYLASLPVKCTSQPRFCQDAIALITSLQGLANRNAPRLYLLATTNKIQEELLRKHGAAYGIANHNLDQFWLDYFLKQKTLLESQLTRTSSLEETIRALQVHAKGLALWHPKVPAGANVALMSAAADSYLPLRVDMDPESFYSWFKVRFPEIPVMLDLTGKLTGTGTVAIDGITFASTKSAKNDAYRFAMEKYLKPGKLDPGFFWYNLDGFPASVTSPGLQYDGRYNADYWVAKKAFMFDLSPWGDEVPNDDSLQDLGTDLETMNKIMEVSYAQRKGEFGILGGFMTWWYKYTTNNKGKHEPVLGEWQFIRIATSYNLANDADAGMGLANASFFMHLPKMPSAATALAPAPIVEHKAGTTYLAFFMLDFDASAWFNQLPTALFSDSNGRGKVPLNWSINPILHARVPHVLPYLYEHRTSLDYFGLSSDGAGYIDPFYLEGKRLGSVKESGIPFYEKFAKSYYQYYNIHNTAFYISESFAGAWMDMATRIEPTGFGKNQPPHFMFGNMPTMQLNDYPHGNAALMKADVMDLFKSSDAAGTRFKAFRCILMPPSFIAQAVAEARAAYPNAPVKVVDAANFFRLYRGGDDGKKGCMEPGFKEFDPTAVVHVQAYCKTSGLVFGGPGTQKSVLPSIYPWPRFNGSGIEIGDYNAIGRPMSEVSSRP